MKRDWLSVGVIWAVLTVIGEYAAVTWSMVPEGYTREATVVNDAYRQLMIMAVPVFTFTVTMLGYSIVRFRSHARPEEDGPNLVATPRVVTTWLVITTGLALAVLIDPGFVGLRELRGEASSDMVVEAVGQRWSWTITYENGASTGLQPGDEMVVPVDTRIRFDVTATDVVHSFWIPAFGLKIDAVPGRTTEMYVTTERTGDYDTDHKLRIQCAELCGLGHAEMYLPVRVVDRDEFTTWLDELERNQPDTEEGA